MIKKIKYLILVVIAATSCLNKYPQDAIETGDAIKTVQDVNQAVLGIYAGFKNPALFSGTLTILPDIQADLVQAVEGFTNTYGDFWRWEIRSTTREVANIYAGLYTIIGRCNFVLDHADIVKANTSDYNQLDDLDNMLGEAYFARALAYSELIKLFCKAYDPESADNTLGVVLSKEYFKPSPTKRASLKESYAFVLSDLEKASELIKTEPISDGRNMDYFTTASVEALYARVYLYMQEWNKAIEYSTKVVENYYFSLAGVQDKATSTQSWFKYMWTNDYSPENIFRVNFSITSYGGSLGRVFLNYDYISFKPDYVPSTWALNLYGRGDLRYDTYFKSVTTGYPHGLQWPVLIKYLGNESFISNRILHVNMPTLFRLAEQYLIRAEAYCQTGQFALAAKDLSKINSKRYSSFGSINITESNWLSIISDERVRELYMEGFRLHDLKRWHLGFERTPQTSTIKGPNANALKINSDDPRFVWPIPQHELDIPGSEIQPNESNK